MKDSFSYRKPQIIVSSLVRGKWIERERCMFFQLHVPVFPREREVD